MNVRPDPEFTTQLAGSYNKDKKRRLRKIDKNVMLDPESDPEFWILARSWNGGYSQGLA